MCFEPKTAKRVSAVTPSVFSYFTQLSKKHDAINLGQGFPSFPPPEWQLKAAQRVMGSAENHLHQYHPPGGVQRLRQQISQMYRHDSLGLPASLSSENCIVTVGASQAISCMCEAFLEDGDEVIVIEPHYDAYTQNINAAGAVVKAVPLMPSSTDGDAWVLDTDTLQRALASPRVKAMFLNTPQNIPGKVWSKDELTYLATKAKEHNLLVLSDEVYDRLLFDGRQHCTIASLPGMWERTVIISSISKPLGVTGWRVGWAVGPTTLVDPISKMVTLQTFSVCTPIQEVAADMLAEVTTNPTHFARLTEEYTARRDLLHGALFDAGLSPVKCRGGMFIVASIADVPKALYLPTSPDPEAPANAGPDWHFCTWLTRELGVTAIPLTVFCEPEYNSMYETYVRFAFCKTTSQIEEAAKRLQRLKSKVEGHGVQ